MTQSVILAIFDYKYSPKDWRRDIVEFYDVVEEVDTEYTVSDGQLIRTIETTKEYASAIAEVAVDPITGPPYEYADGNYHADRSEIFQITHIKTTDWQEFSANSYILTIDDFDVLKNTHTISHQTVDGKIPLAPTKASVLSALILQPFVAKLQYDCAWVTNTTNLDLPWAEDQQDIDTAARRQQQRDTAIVRTIQIPMNPYYKPGDTVWLIDEGRMIDAAHMLVAVKHTQSSETGKAVSDLTLEFWNRTP